MKKFAKAVIATVLLVLCLTLSACGDKYASRFNSSAMVSKSTSTEASVSFGSFNGVYVIKLKNTGKDEACITYNATLEKGNIKVYYDYNDEKLSLFKIGANGSMEGKTDAFTSNQTIYIVIESDGKCEEGSFSFSLEKARK